jgi:hypothetical protein
MPKNTKLMMKMLVGVKAEIVNSAEPETHKKANRCTTVAVYKFINLFFFLKSDYGMYCICENCLNIVITKKREKGPSCGF